MKFEDALAMVDKSAPAQRGGYVAGAANWDGRTEEQAAEDKGNTAWSFETEHIPWSFADQEGEGQPGPKRKAPQFPELFGKKQKLGGAGASVVKNAVVTLNEYKAGLKYELLEAKGPVHMPVFVFGVTVNGQKFSGEGKSKKLAKQAAAESALKSIVQFKNPLSAQAAMGLGGLQAPWQQDFTADTEPGHQMLRPFEDTAGPMDTQGEGSSSAPPCPPVEQEVEQEEAVKPRLKENPGQDASNEVKNPVMILNEMRPGLSFDISESGDTPSNKKFTTRVEVEGQQFEGSGASKKLAKQAVAKAVLNKIYKYNFTAMVQRGGSTPGTTKEWDAVEMDQGVADSVGRLVLARYDQLMKDDVQHSKRKVIAGIVMSRDEAMEDLEVVTVSTGTKCVCGEYMSVSGTALNDCHAEIVSRRCLQDFLYTQLELEGRGQGGGVLEPAEGGGYRLRTNIRLHLYINTAPCGDARIFSPHEAEQGEESDKHPNRKARGQLRTKIESGEGTIPVKKDQDVQTWDGVLQGARLLTMSCSDKLARWNLLGVQGALLTAYLEPTYLYSIVLGSLFHPTHMYRAVSGRLTHSLPALLPSLYRLHTPRLNLLSSREVRQPGKAPNHSVNWSLGCAKVEVVDAMKGKQEGGRPSRLAKLEFFRRWRLLAKVPGLRRRQEVASTGNYGEAKLACRDFQAAKLELVKAFKKAELGCWVEKPMEQDEFEDST